MRKILFILALSVTVAAQSQTTGYVLINSDGSVRLPDNSITNAMIAGSIAQSKITNLASDLSGKASLASPTFTGTVSLATLTATGAITSSGTAGVGYSSGAGSTVTQQTNKSTGVTINKTCGQITMNGAALAAGAEVAFTVTNSTVAATDVVIVNIQSVGTAGSYLVSVGAVSNGSFSVTVSNASAGSLSQAIVLNFAVIKSVSN